MMKQKNSAGLIIGSIVAPHPFSIGSVTFDVDTLVAASAMIVIGFQAVLFWLFTQVYAGSEGFLPEEPKVQRVLEKLSLERGLVLGGLIGLGIPESNAKAYESALKEGGVVIGVHCRSNDDCNDVKKRFQELNGENIITV